ncbi:hypothetical protein GCM10011591_05990 [Nocardia camponoti]|uniref:SMI1/KNR4 family protein n=2 Tax=Nocardia camponoti TaxID=1616106 RepID=A0A917Q8V3_9NOCA|nr:hypothetical protein GCM10011591_05990 [Nocardia camponoti]
MTSLLDANELPAGFSYPKGFEHIVELNLVNLEPWEIMFGSLLQARLHGTEKRYPGKGYIPFARRGDNDDVECWIAPGNQEVVIVHDFASLGYEVRRTFPHFYDWFRQAIDDLIEFDELG